MKEKIIALIIAVVIVGTFFLVTNNNNRNSAKSIEAQIPAEHIHKSGNGITVEYLREFFETNGFTFKGPDKQTDTYYFSAKSKIADGAAEIVAQIYQEQSNNEITLIEIMVIWNAVNLYEQDKEKVTAYVTDTSKEVFSTLAQIPYTTAETDKAQKWVIDNVGNAFSEDASEDNYFTRDFGEANFRMYGSPIFRTFEINLGFS